MCALPPTPGLVSHSDLDDRAIDALKEFNEEGALQVLLQFKDSDLSHVQVRCAVVSLLFKLLCPLSMIIPYLQHIADPKVLIVLSNMLCYNLL